MYLQLIMQVEEVRAYKEELMRQKKLMIEQKMQQAEEKRLTMLKSKALKAHDEEAKVGEWVSELVTAVNDTEKDAVSEWQKLMIEQKMQQAEEKRLTMLKSKALKAHDEEAKVSEWVPEVNDRENNAAGRGEEITLCWGPRLSKLMVKRQRLVSEWVN